MPCCSKCLAKLFCGCCRREPEDLGLFDEQGRRTFNKTTAVNILCNQIRIAQKSLDVFVFCVTSASIITALINAHKKGIAVRIIMYLPHVSCSNRVNPCAKRLKNAGVPLRWLDTALSTGHFILIDPRVTEGHVVTWGICAPHTPTSSNVLDDMRSVKVLDERNAIWLANTFDWTWDSLQPPTTSAQGSRRR